MGGPNPHRTLLLGYLWAIFWFQGYHAYLFPGGPGSPLSGRSWPPGSPWPLPFFWKSSPHLVTFNPTAFKIIKNFTTPCEPIDFVIGKYNNSFLFPVYGNDRSGPAPYIFALDALVITMNDNEGENECSKYPSLSDDPGTHEQYSLQIAVNEGKATAPFKQKLYGGHSMGWKHFPN